MSQTKREKKEKKAAYRKKTEERSEHSAIYNNPEKQHRYLTFPINL